ncbi:Hypothetical_protein [Hexamita inflata]|uniref:Hypothetical_protein n=1 Tax=Hexamita inflata TaxID=28002 RepID=A0AA86RAK8_9EUKA|nr:Hypothetical protein HINF_LOCUS61505 [Hexamita inflata]CAI9973863.1 Hypothetical protein HINF_LOCUS61508 [Hexamita inflata]
MHFDIQWNQPRQSTSPEKSHRFQTLRNNIPKQKQTTNKHVKSYTDIRPYKRKILNVNQDVNFQEQCSVAKMLDCALTLSPFHFDDIVARKDPNKQVKRVQAKRIFIHHDEISLNDFHVNNEQQLILSQSLANRQRVMRQFKELNGYDLYDFKTM